MKTDTAGLLFIPLCGLKEFSPRGGRLCSQPGSMLGFLVLVDVGRHGSVGWPSIGVTAADVRCCPFSVSILVKPCAFLGSLHRPGTVEDLGFGGVSYVELLILCERWAGERGWSWRCVCPRKDVLTAQFQCPLFLLDRTLIFGALAGS